MFNVIFLNLIINENIIQICLTKIIKIFKKNIVYILLINNRIVYQFKWEHSIFIRFKEDDKYNKIFII